MAHGMSGFTGAIVVGATTFGPGGTAKIEGWNLDLSAKVLEDTGGGDPYTGRLTLYGDWKAEATIQNPSAGGLAVGGLIGVEATISLKEKVSDTNPVFTGVGIITGVKRAHGWDSQSKITLTIECSDPTGPTVNV